MFTPRSVGVSMRWRNSCGRMSPTRCVAALVWPLAWQSKQATPRLGRSDAAVLGRVELLLRERRHQQPQALELLGVQDAVEQLVEVRRCVTSLPCETSPRSGRVVRKIGGGNSGRKWSGRSKSRSKRVRSRSVLLLDLVDVELREEHAAFGVVRVRQRAGSRRGTGPCRGSPSGVIGGERLPGHALRQLRRARPPAPPCRATSSRPWRAGWRGRSARSSRSVCRFIDLRLWPPSCGP